jgi:hypothetical protein
VKEKLVLKCERVLFMKAMCENKEHGRKCVYQVVVVKFMEGFP